MMLPGLPLQILGLFFGFMLVAIIIVSFLFGFFMVTLLFSRVVSVCYTEVYILRHLRIV